MINVGVVSVSVHLKNNHYVDEMCMIIYVGVVSVSIHLKNNHYMDEMCIIINIGVVSVSIHLKNNHYVDEMCKILVLFICLFCLYIDIFVLSLYSALTIFCYHVFI